MKNKHNYFIKNNDGSLKSFFYVFHVYGCMKKLRIISIMPS
jgi:hypothetical protein